MTDSCVEELEVQPPTLKHFIKVVQKHGNVFMLNELYAHDQKQPNEIILGVVCYISNVTKNHDRQLLVIYLREVTVNCEKGKVFTLYAFNKFATSLADAGLRKGDFAAFRSAYIEENTKYHIENGCHDLQARMGIPPRAGAKIFFIRRSRHTNFCNSRRLLSVRYPFPHASLKRLPSTFSREPSAITLDREQSPNLIETACNSGRVPPLVDVSERLKVNCTSRRASCFSPTYSPTDSISYAVSPDLSYRVLQTHGSLDENAVRLQTTRVKYTYKKVSELLEPEQKVNMYGVISSITKMPTETTKHAIVRLKDETCRPNQEFRVHIFFKCEQTFPKLEHGYILRLHRMKTEMFDGVLDGRVFHASDTVTFPPEGQGLKNAFSTAGSFHFCDSDARRLTELRRWIASLNQPPMAPTPPPSTVHSTVPLSPQVVDSASLPTAVMADMHQSVRPSQPAAVTTDMHQSVGPSQPTTQVAEFVGSSEPIEALLSEIKKEGSYSLVCKVLKLEILSDEMLILTVTDGTLCTLSVCFDQNSDIQEEAYASREVRILVLDPPLKLRLLKKNAFVELTNVKVQVNSVPQFKRPILSFRMTGNDCSVAIYRGLDPKAVTLRRKLKAMHLKQCPGESTELQIRKVAPEICKSQQPGGCVSPSSSISFSSLSSSDSGSLNTYTEYDSEINSNGKSENRSSDLIKEAEKSVSRPVSIVSRKRPLSHEDVRFGNGHKFQKLMSEDSDSQRVVDIGVAGTQTNDETFPQIDVSTKNSNSSELLSDVNQSHSGSVSQNTGIQRQTVSKQISSHSNNMELTNSNSLSVMSELDTNCASSFKQVDRSDVLSGAHGIKSVAPPSVKKPDTSERPVHSQEHNISSFSVTSSEDQFVSAVSSPIPEQCDPVLVSATVSKDKHESRIITSAQQEGNISLPSTTKQHISLHKTKDSVIKSSQKLQEDVTFPLLLASSNATVLSKKHVSTLLNNVGKVATDIHCTSGRTYDSLEQASNIQDQRSQGVTPTSSIPDSSSFQHSFESEVDTVDHSVRSLSETVVHNALTTEPTDSVSCPVFSDYALQNSPRISTITSPAHNGVVDNKVAARQHKLSGAEKSVDNVKNKSVFKALPAEISRGDKSSVSGSVSVAQLPVQEDDQSNLEEYAQVVQNTPPPLMSVADHKFQSLHKSMAEQSISNILSFPVLDTNSEFTGNRKHKEKYAEHAVVSKQDMRQDYLAGNILHEDDAQEVVDEVNEMYDQFADAIKTRSDAQYYTSTQSGSSQSMNCVYNADFLGHGEVSDAQSLASEVIPTSEVDELDVSDRFSALTQACVTDRVLSNNQADESVVFLEDGSNVTSSVTKNNASLHITGKRSHVFEENKTRSEVKEDCIEQGHRRCSVLRDKFTAEDEHMEVSSAELGSNVLKYEVTFASGINAMPGVLTANISYIKRKRTTGNEQVYLLKAWVKDIEPPISSGSETNIITGFCKCCHHMQSYEALVKRPGTNQPVCGHCFQRGKKKPVALAFLLRLYLIDENDDELIVTVAAQHGVELLGCPVNAYLSDSMARRRVRQILTKLIEKNKNVPLYNRGPMLKLLIVPVCTSEGMEYIVHNTYLLSS